MEEENAAAVAVAKRMDRIYNALSAELREADQRTGMYLRSGDPQEAHACANYARALLQTRDWIRADRFPTDGGPQELMT